MSKFLILLNKKSITTKYYVDRLKDDEYIKADKIYKYLLNNYKVLESFNYLVSPEKA